jgi:hypothetical protein
MRQKHLEKHQEIPQHVSLTRSRIEIEEEFKTRSIRNERH